MSYGVRRLAAFAVGGSVVVHLYVTPEHLEQKPYLGMLLLAGSALLGYAAVQLVRSGDLLAWRVGAVVSAAMVVGFFASRTVGLPDGFRETGWEAPFGPLALLFKGCYLMLFGLATRRRRHAEGYIKWETAAGRNPWSALDAYRRRGGRIDWDDWFRVWNDITGVTSLAPAADRGPTGLSSPVVRRTMSAGSPARRSAAHPGGQRHLYDALPAAERRIRTRLAVPTGAEYCGEVRAASAAASANGSTVATGSSSGLSVFKRKVTL